MTATRADIDDFLALHRIALVGVSRNPKDFSRILFRDMVARGYDMVPINPLADEIDGKSCFASLRDPRLQENVLRIEGALLMTSPIATESVVRDCLATGVRRVWMHRGGGQGAVSQAAVEFCRENGIRVVEGHCPLMFLSPTPFFHRVHGFFLKLGRRYPASPVASR